MKFCKPFSFKRTVNREIIACTGNNFSVYSPFKRKWFAELQDEQLDILEIPQKKEKMAIAGTDLSEFLDEFSHDYADQWPAGEQYIQNYIDEFLKFKGL